MEPELKNNKIEVVKNLILQAFYFLENEYYYTPIYKVEYDNLFLESLDVDYVNETKKRKITISYTKSKNDNEIKYTFSGSITRIPYLSVEDFFSFVNYLQSTGNNFSTSLINDFNENQAENILLHIAKLLKELTPKIITGEEWLENYYPRKD